ncbi:TPA: hypothetical protein JGU28_004566 [Salmonella enterica]|nr:hypothetical protein [Salmonella enterica]
MFFDKLRKMIFGPICFLFFALLSGYFPSVRHIFILLSGYLLIYFTIFLFIEQSINNVTSFHQRNNQKGIHRQPVKYFIKNKGDVVHAYKVIFNVGYAIIAILVLTHEGL